jgi:hypothetical protein
MPGTEHDDRAGLLDVSGFTLSDLSALDDSVVADAIRRLLPDLNGQGDDFTLFSNFNSSLP